MGQFRQENYRHELYQWKTYLPLYLGNPWQHQYHLQYGNLSGDQLQENSEASKIHVAKIASDMGDESFHKETSKLFTKK